MPPALVNAGYQVRVGAHSWDLSGRRSVNRLDRATLRFPITATTIKVASPYGGGIYIEVPIGASAGVVNVSVTGAVRSPYFSAKSFHQTTPAEWDTEKTHPAPWADFQSDKFMSQVPRKWIYNMTGTQATQLMVDWDKAMDAINDLMGFPLIRGKETMYPPVDIIMRSSVHAPGYPAVNVTSNANSEVSPAGYAGNYIVRGPAITLTAANIEFHEQGHGYFFPKFGGESESNVNLLQPAMLYRAFGKTIDEAQNGSFGGGSPFITVDTTAIAWMCVFSFSPNEIPMQQLEKQYQHKGHAKWMDIARIYATPSNPNAGWEKLDAYWRSFMLDDANNVPYGTGTDDLLLRLSRARRQGHPPALPLLGHPSAKPLRPRRRPRCGEPHAGPRHQGQTPPLQIHRPRQQRRLPGLLPELVGQETQRRRRIGRKPTTPCSGMRPWMPTGPTIPTSAPITAPSMSKPAPPKSAPASMNSSTSISPAASRRNPMSFAIAPTGDQRQHHRHDRHHRHRSRRSGPIPL